MGEFKEDGIGPRTEKREFSQVPDGENLSETLERGVETVSGVEAALSNIQSSKDESDATRTSLNVSDNINYEKIRDVAFESFSDNIYNHLDLESTYTLGTDIEGQPDNAADDLIKYLDDDRGVSDLMRFDVSGPTPKSSKDTLENFGLTEKNSGELSEFGSYVADQVFEYSED